MQIIFPGNLASLSSFLVILRIEFRFWTSKVPLCRSILYNRVPHKPVLEGMAGVALFITGHEETQ